MSLFAFDLMTIIASVPGVKYVMFCFLIDDYIFGVVCGSFAKDINTVPIILKRKGFFETRWMNYPTLCFWEIPVSFFWFCFYSFLVFCPLGTHPASYQKPNSPTNQTRFLEERFSLKKWPLIKCLTSHPLCYLHCAAWGESAAAHCIALSVLAGAVKASNSPTRKPAYCSTITQSWAG